MILSLDFSQIELRVGAYCCRDEVMLETYRKGGDIHAATAAAIYGDAFDKADREQRTVAKRVNFGCFYGLYPRGLQRTLKLDAGIEKTEDECREILDSLKRGYPGLTQWQTITKAEAASCGYVETALGRRRYLPDIRSKDWSKRSYAERCALNTPIQGTAADILKIAIARILCGLPERPWLRPILQIHDELTFIVPENKLGEAVFFIKSCMEQTPFEGFDVPLIAEAKAGKTFGQLRSIEETEKETNRTEEEKG